MLGKLRRHNSEGFGLIEMTVLIVIIGIIAAIAMQSSQSIMSDSRVANTEAEMDMIGHAIVGNPDLMNGSKRSDFGYVGDVGAFPANLQALYQNPGSYSTWDGPYIAQGLVEDSAGYQNDAWNTAYTYSGGITVQSTGSGSTLSHKLASSTTDYLLNTLSGSATDSSGAEPGINYGDSISIEIVIPNGSGGTSIEAATPDSSGSFEVDSLPVGTHLIRAIYEPTVDTLLRYATILPRHNGEVIFRFPGVLFGSGGGGGSPTIDTLTLRPNGAGSITLLGNSGCWPQYMCVDEVTSDEHSTWVNRSANSYRTDVYAIENPSVSVGTITSVIVHCRARKHWNHGYVRPTIYVGSTEYNGTEQSLTTSYADYSHTWTTNPATSAAWTWTEINNLQAGVRIKGQNWQFPAYCTQVWVEVIREQ